MKEEPVFVCSHIFNDTKSVLLVVKEDNDWQFLCGEEHDEIPEVVGLNHLLERDKTLFDVLKLKNNYEAERKKVGGKWKIRKIT